MNGLPSFSCLASLMDFCGKCRWQGCYEEDCAEVIVWSRMWLFTIRFFALTNFYLIASVKLSQKKCDVLSFVEK